MTMRMTLMGWLAAGCFLAQSVLAQGSQIVVNDPDGAAARVAAPVSVRVDLAKLKEGNEKSESFRLVEVVKGNEATGKSVPAQFEPDAPGSRCGTLWWLMPEGPEGERRFRLVVAEEAASDGMNATHDKQQKFVDVTDGDRPVLRYNHGTVPPPKEIVDHFEKGREHPLYYARGDYIHPVFGPDGEKLTDDYSLNHPHHRGVFWSWPVLRYKGEVRDIWAVRVLANQPGGAWARPVAMNRVSAGPVLARIDAENVWKWGDEIPIVREDVSIRAFHSHDRCRFLDIEVRLTALADDVSIGGRPKAGYGGFTFRTLPEFEDRNIALHVDPQEASPRRAWFHLTGKIPGAKGTVGMALLEHVTNPAYPNYPAPKTAERVPFGKYPPWRSVTPAFPGDREITLSQEKPLVLKHRLWIHPGTVEEAVLSEIWDTYAHPVQARVIE